MKFVRFNLPGEGARLGVLIEDKVLDLTTRTEGKLLSFQDLIKETKEKRLPIKCIVEEYLKSSKKDNKRFDYEELAAGLKNPDKAHLLLPLVPPEVWAAGVTYRRSAEARIEESHSKDVYSKVYNAVRPELFFKATCHRVVGPGDDIGIRSDSNWQVPEPELGLVLDEKAEIVAYIIGNDVSCRDIEGENPLYLPQAKIFKNSCALGPLLTLPEAIDDPYNLNIKCEIFRNGNLVFSESANTRQLKRKLEELASFLARDNIVFPGTVLLTGTCIVPPDSFSLQKGDVVQISIDYLGTLFNKVN
jgi:2-dehydro-3-deoxy-D-arabinonate dehydratase